ncbi:glycosyltransferase [Halostreptopolyspora alba]|uniref:glycosyltransferase n=1 Tax=Halostreptopolyspora alba TaxID=2487137 RepID=UPI00372400F5
MGAAHGRHLDIPRRADAFVTHADIGGFGEGLYIGTPMIAVPRAVDQFDNADRLQEMGVAKRIDAGEALRGSPLRPDGAGLRTGDQSAPRGDQLPTAIRRGRRATRRGSPTGPPASTPVDRSGASPVERGGMAPPSGSAEPRRSRLRSCLSPTLSGNFTIATSPSS